MSRPLRGPTGGGGSGGTGGRRRVAKEPHERAKGEAACDSQGAAGGERVAAVDEGGVSEGCLRLFKPFGYG